MFGFGNKGISAQTAARHIGRLMGIKVEGNPWIEEIQFGLSQNMMQGFFGSFGMEDHTRWSIRYKAILNEPTPDNCNFGRGDIKLSHKSMGRNEMRWIEFDFWSVDNEPCDVSIGLDDKSKDGCSESLFTASPDQIQIALEIAKWAIAKGLGEGEGAANRIVSRKVVRWNASSRDDVI